MPDALMQPRRNAAFLTGLRTLLLSVSVTSCAPLDAYYVTRPEHERHIREESNRSVRELAQIERQRVHIASLEHNLQIVLGRLYCIDERVQTFLSACHQSVGSAGGTSAPGACPANIRDAVLTFLSSQPHVVAYLDAHKTRDDLIPLRRTQLRDLVHKNRLLSTRFIVVSHPMDSSADSVSDAEKRASEVVDFIREIGKTDSDEPVQLKIHGPWVFRYRLSGSDIERILQRGKQLDRPIGREPQDLRKGIWVFRTDCHIPD